MSILREKTAPAAGPSNLRECTYADLGRPPLCVDLDGTLIKTDLLFESLARLLRLRPWLLLLLPYWLLQGRAVLKRQLARWTAIDPGSLPYNLEFLAWLRSERATGRVLLLVTAADHVLAHQVASYVGLFDQVLATSGTRNLSGRSKLAAIREQIPGAFDYAGNAAADLAVWRHCARAIAVNASPALVKRVRRDCGEIQEHDSAGGGWRAYLKALRLYQWAKNALLFVPLITSHQLTHPVLLLKAALGVVLFGLCSSSQYILNDLMDLDADRKHEVKRQRPFASGAVPLQAGFVMAGLLLTAGLGIAMVWSPGLAAVLAVYFVLSLAYSMSIKAVILLDAFVLAGLYTLRIVAGHFVSGVAFSAWLLSFAYFLFLSLAFSKRWAELTNAQRASRPVEGRGYVAGDAMQVNLFGVCSAFLSTVVFILYLQSDAVRVLYAQPQLLWLLSPILLYWISRLWVLCSRGAVRDEDPLLFVLKDPVTYLVAAIAGLVMFAAKFGALGAIP